MSMICRFACIDNLRHHTARSQQACSRQSGHEDDAVYHSEQPQLEPSEILPTENSAFMKQKRKFAVSATRRDTPG